jgi:ABC-type transporter MlaC component
MSEILGWGEFDPPVKNDFTTDKGAFQEKNKINKMGVEFITEKQDNFRNPFNIKGMSKVDQIIEYLKEEN